MMQKIKPKVASNIQCHIDLDCKIAYAFFYKKDEY
jgi:hypothetical protein